MNKSLIFGSVFFSLVLIIASSYFSYYSANQALSLRKCADEYYGQIVNIETLKNGKHVIYLNIYKFMDFELSTKNYKLELDLESNLYGVEEHMRKKLFIKLYRDCESGRFYIDDNNHGFQLLILQFMWSFFGTLSGGLAVFLTMYIILTVIISILYIAVKISVELIKSHKYGVKSDNQSLLKAEYKATFQNGL